MNYTNPTDPVRVIGAQHAPARVDQTVKPTQN